MSILQQLLTDCALSQQASGVPLALRVFLTPSSTMLLEHEGRGFVVDVSFGDGHSIDPHSLPFDLLWISVITSVSFRKKLLQLGLSVRVSG